MHSRHNENVVVHYYLLLSFIPLAFTYTLTFIACISRVVIGIMLRMFSRSLNAGNNLDSKTLTLNQNLIICLKMKPVWATQSSVY